MKIPEFRYYVRGEEQPYEKMARIKKTIEDKKLWSIKPNELTLEMLLPPFGENAFHTAARFGQLRYLPSNFLTFDFLSRLSPDGDSAYHLAALNGCLDQIPIEGNDVMLRLFFLRNASGQSVLHCAFSRRPKSLDAIPTPYLTRIWLTLPDSRGITPVHLAADLGLLKELLKRDLITLDDLLAKSGGGWSALQDAALHHIDQLCPPPPAWGKEYGRIREHLERVFFYYNYLPMQDDDDRELRKWLVTLAQVSIQYNG